ncbi:MAG: peptidoglycan editing factor PgeF [Bacteroidales bacterium]
MSVSVRTKDTIMYLSCISNSACIAGFTTRYGGVSTNKYASLNTGLNTKDTKKNIVHNRNLFFNTITPGYKPVCLEQIHSNSVHKVDSQYESPQQGDAFYTRKKGILLTITTADCAPILIHDTQYTIIAAIHSGWRGAHSHIIENTISELSQYVTPESLHAYIGPMIQQSAYKVGEEFYTFFPSTYIQKIKNAFHFNLNQYIEDTLTKCNIGTITNTKLCTHGNPNLFYSYRRDSETGRIMSYIGLK